LPGRPQPADPAAGVPGHQSRASAEEEQLLGPRLGAVYRPTDQTILSAGYGLIWIETAGITTPFSTPTFPFGHLARGPGRNLQPAEHTEPRGAERRARGRQLRDDHDGPRSAGRTAGLQASVLGASGRCLEPPTSSGDPATDEMGRRRAPPRAGLFRRESLSQHGVERSRAPTGRCILPRQPADVAGRTGRMLEQVARDSPRGRTSATGPVRRAP
jgi:hypothetical protein